MTIDPNRPFNARIVPTCAALALVLLGAWLRLHRLDAMEFKADEQEALRLSVAFLADRPWASVRAWPSHGMLSSNGVALAPLYTWIIAALWLPTGDPIAVTRLIALGNAICLYPLWRWARRRADETRALLVLAIAAVSPFTVIFSRKLWNLDLLLPGVLGVLWGIEWLRDRKPWWGIALIVVGGLWISQVHQSGPIAMVLLCVAVGLQVLVDRRRGATFRLPRPTFGEAVTIAGAVALALIFWVPYLDYLLHLIPTGVLAARPKLAVVAPDLLVRIEAQIVPVDLLSFFAPHRDEFLRDPMRAGFYYATVVLGAPLMVYGLWRWIRSPWSVPVVGIWWWLIVAAFAIARIPCHPSYVLTLAPVTAMLPAGAFDPPDRRAAIARALTAWRIVYIAGLLALTVATESWLADRGGAAGPYGVTYNVRIAQADTIVRRLAAEPHEPAAGELRAGDSSSARSCALVPPELIWLVRWRDGGRHTIPATLEICDGWIAEGDRLVYRWTIRE